MGLSTAWRPFPPSCLFKGDAVGIHTLAVQGFFISDGDRSFSAGSACHAISGGQLAICSMAIVGSELSRADSVLNASPCTDPGASASSCRVDAHDDGCESDWNRR